MPTIAPEMVMKIDEIDMICIGEGEGSIIDVCEAIAKQKSLKTIPNLWIKDNGRIIKNPLRELINMNEVPEQIWEPFDKRHLYRAYKGECFIVYEVIEKN